MENEILNTQEPQTEASEDTLNVAKAENSKESVGENQQGDIKGLDFKFFRNCSGSLKKFSILIFVINLFVAIGITGALMVVLAINLGTQMLSLLALPIVTVFIILVVLARFVSALIYGFAEIVEKAEKN